MDNNSQILDEGLHEQRELPIADPSKRFFAAIIDRLLIFAIGAMGIVPLGLLVDEINNDLFAAMFILFGLFYFVCQWLYFALMESGSRQATLGKRALKIRVVDDAYDRISFGKASGRFFAKILSGIANIGFFMILFTERKQGLHDILAKTLVVDAK